MKPNVIPGPSVDPLAGDESPNMPAVALPTAYKQGIGRPSCESTRAFVSTFGPPVVPEHPA